MNLILSSTILVPTVIILIILLSVSLFYLIKFALIIIRVQDVVEDSLDILDEKYADISEILRRPLFFDSPEIRSVLMSVEDVRKSILGIAQALTSVDGEISTSEPDALSPGPEQGNKEIGREEKEN